MCAADARPDLVERRARRLRQVAALVGGADRRQLPLQRRHLQRAGAVGEVERDGRGRGRERRQLVVVAPGAEVAPVRLVGSPGVGRHGSVRIGGRRRSEPGRVRPGGRGDLVARRRRRDDVGAGHSMTLVSAHAIWRAIAVVSQRPEYRAGSNPAALQKSGLVGGGGFDSRPSRGSVSAIKCGD